MVPAVSSSTRSPSALIPVPTGTSAGCPSGSPPERGSPRTATRPGEGVALREILSTCRGRSRAAPHAPALVVDHLVEGLTVRPAPPLQLRRRQELAGVADAEIGDRHHVLGD